MPNNSSNSPSGHLSAVDIHATLFIIQTPSQANVYTVQATGMTVCFLHSENYGYGRLNISESIRHCRLIYFVYSFILPENWGSPGAFFK